MNELINYLVSLGWFSGTLEANINIKNAFEGFSGRASETWESKITFQTKGIKKSENDWLIPPVYMESQSFETPEQFAKRVLSVIKK
jgi:hypothetical protein